VQPPRVCDKSVQILAACCVNYHDCWVQSEHSLLGSIVTHVKDHHLQGQAPGVKFPRVLGIEAAGIVEEAPGNEFAKVRQQFRVWAVQLGSCRPKS